ncbi:MAG: hypothetical protein KIS66_14140 [Fimbriimonadaceae bacterium]|nr:hypothetical protein [Fimbriimonadaceae bacterium]
MAPVPHRPPPSDFRRQAFLPLCLLASLLVVFVRLAYLQVWSPPSHQARGAVRTQREATDFWGRAESRLRREVRRVGKGTVLAGSLLVIGAIGFGLSAAVGHRRRTRCR